jgi:subtilase-type serine protease
MAPTRCESFVYPPRPEIHSKEPCGKSGWTPWLQGIGTFGSRDGGSTALGFSSSGGGVLVGADRRFGDRWWASADIGGGRIGIDVNGIGPSTLQTLDVGAAVGVNLGRGYLRGIASYSHGWHTTRRDVDYLSVRATGDHGSDRVSLVVDGAYPFEWQSIVVEPLASLRYSYLSQGQVDESGAAGVNLRVAARTDALYSTAIGLRLHTALFKYRYFYKIFEWADGLWTPELNVRWRRVWDGADRHLDALMPDAPEDALAYRVAASDARSGVEFGARVRFQPLASRISVALEYDAFMGWGDANHNIGLAVRVPL